MALRCARVLALGRAANVSCLQAPCASQLLARRWHRSSAHEGIGNIVGAAGVPASPVDARAPSSDLLEILNSSLPQKAIGMVWLGIASNLALTVGKFAAGIAGHSAALVADAGHSLSDLVSDFATLYVVKISREPPDEGHPYGHGKMESMGSLGISVGLVGAGLSLGWHAIHQISAILNNATEVVEGPSWLAMGVCVASLAIKEVLFHATMRVGKSEHSPALIANAWHHRLDAMSSVIALVGIGGAMLGWPVLDPLGGLLVSGLIVKVGAELSVSSVRDLTDTVLNPGEMARLAALARTVPGVLSVHRFRSRPVGGCVMLDLSIRVPFHSTVSMAHRIAERVRSNIMTNASCVSDVVVHVDPHVASALSAPSVSEDEFEAKVRDLVSSISGVQAVTHMSDKFFVEIQIMVDEHLMLRWQVRDARAVSARVRRAVEGLADVAHADVHLELLRHDPPSS